MSRSINAFTITEILVVMILGGIISVLVYHAVTTTTVMFHDFEKRQHKIQQITSWYTLLYSEIAKAKEAEVKEGRLMLVDKGRTIVFHANTNALFWQGDSAKDSIPLTEGRFIMYGNDSTASVQCITLEFQHDGERMQWQFYKKYSAAALVNKLVVP